MKYLNGLVILMFLIFIGQRSWYAYEDYHNEKIWNKAVAESERICQENPCSCHTCRSDGTIWQTQDMCDGPQCPGWRDYWSTKLETDENDLRTAAGIIGGTRPVEVVKKSSPVPFMVSSVATGDGNYFVVESSGNVGIGTIVPQYMIDINLVMTNYRTIRITGANRVYIMHVDEKNNITGYESTNVPEAWEKDRNNFRTAEGVQGGGDTGARGIFYLGTGGKQDSKKEMR